MTKCRHMRIDDCGCAEEEFDENWTPDFVHEQVVAEIEGHVAKWQPRLPWLAGWRIRVKPIPEGHGEWTMRIDSAMYVKVATIEVRASIWDEDPILADEHSPELMVLHELAHLLFEPVRYVMFNWTLSEDETVPQPALLATQDAEESAVWHLARTLLALDRDLTQARGESSAYHAVAERLSGDLVKRTRAKRKVTP